ncbi:MAG: outer membrane beta-barrel protein [Luteitalea sp.]|nr:outer membrane beta-barrel protein [Luteitalea sp.]
MSAAGRGGGSSTTLMGASTASRWMRMGMACSRRRRLSKYSCGALVGSQLMIMLLAPVAQAQEEEEDPVASAPVHLGPVGLAPTIGISNLGVDTNVFHRPSESDSDFTATLTPATEAWLHTGDGLLSVNGNVELVYFAQFKGERSVNGFGETRYEYRFNKLRPFASFSALSTRARPGYEIDARARRSGNEVTAGVELQALSRTSVELSARRRTVDFAGDAVFLDTRLEEVLNRSLDGVDLAIRHRLTPLTTLLVSTSGERERFDLNTIRNTDSFRFTTGFELSQFALIRGRALVGYRRLTSAAGGELPGFSGMTADIDVAYTAPTNTRVTLGVTSDVEYSFEIEYPYYVQTGWTTSVTQRVTGPWDVVLFGGRDRLGYRGETELLPGQRVDLVDHVGGGVGYQLGQDTRLGFNVLSYHRRSDLPSRGYSVIRSGLSVTYGF